MEGVFFMKKNRFLLLLIIPVFLTGCLLPSQITNLMDSPTATATTSPTATAEPIQPTLNPAISLQDEDVVATVQRTYQQIYASVNSSVVNIQVTTSDGWYTSSAQGSGFVWDTEGHIVTNNHVVENASEITVVFSDGTSVSANIVGTDPQSDLAVIQVDPTAASLEPVTLGDSHAVTVGDLVIAIGNPYGLAGTMTQGIVSALSRSLTVDSNDQSSYSTYTIPDIIQTDAAINPGNSGGVLVNLSGEVIGVTSAIQSSTSANAGIGFVIPSHIVERIVPVLISSGSYQHPQLGLSGVTLTPSIDNTLGLDSKQTGILITGVDQFGAADQAGLIATTRNFSRRGEFSYNVGDVITAIDGTPIKTYEAMVSYIFNQTTSGQTVSLTVLRGGTERTVDLTLSAN